MTENRCRDSSPKVDLFLAQINLINSAKSEIVLQKQFLPKIKSTRRQKMLSTTALPLLLRRAKKNVCRSFASLSSSAAMDLEDRFGAHNYHPLPVVLSRGEGTKLYDVSFFV